MELSVESGGGGRPPPTPQISLVGLFLACMVAGGVQYGWALQLSLLTPYVQVFKRVCTRACFSPRVCIVVVKISNLLNVNILYRGFYDGYCVILFESVEFVFFGLLSFLIHFLGEKTERKLGDTQCVAAGISCNIFNNIWLHETNFFDQ